MTQQKSNWREEGEGGGIRERREEGEGVREGGGRREGMRERGRDKEGGRVTNETCRG